MARVVLENIYKNFSSRGGDTVIPQKTGLGTITKFPSSSQKIRSTKPKPTQNSILRNINLTVADGEFMVLVGPSGCGKSTLLRIIAGLEELTVGNVWVGDRLLNNLPPKERDIAMVFQNYALYPHLKVYDNIAFGLRRMGDNTRTMSSFQRVESVLTAITRNLPNTLRYLTPKEHLIAQRVHKVAQLLQIETLLDRLPKELSGGQKQRVALGRAIARNPQLFLMDEPLSNLDAKLRTETRSQIVTLQRQLGTTTIYVTHDQTEAMTMGDRIAVMNQGKIQQIAPPLEIYHHPANRFVAEFIGSPPMNFIEVEGSNLSTVIHPQFTLSLSSHWQSALSAYQGRSLLLGIRPEHFNIGTPGTENLWVIVELVEALGNDTYISAYLKEDNKTSLKVRIAPDMIVKPGETLWLSINQDKIHLFDPNTGDSITR